MGHSVRDRDRQRIDPRGLSRAEAAAYIGVSPSLFDEMVKDRRMPAPKRINSRTVWDRRRLDEAFDAKSMGHRSVSGAPAMPRIKLPFLVFDRDRHGNTRAYVRVPGRNKVRMRAPIGSPEFMAEYNSAISETATAPRGPREGKPGSFRNLCVGYYSSAEFKRLDRGTQTWRRHHLDLIAEGHGEKPVAMLEGRHIRRLRDELSATPVVTNKRLKALRALFAWAVEDEAAPHDPTVGVRLLKHVSGGYHSWTLAEIGQFEKRHPLGTKARLAIALLLYTACRREDAVRLGPQHMRGGRLHYRQAKNEHRNPVDLDIPIHPDLLAAVDATPSGH